jgi:3-hydroxybutyryl-CoA dehydratase
MEPHVLFWEGLVPDLSDVSPARTIGEADVLAFAALSGDWNPIHTDAVFAAEHGIGGERIVHGLLVVAIASGLFTRSTLGSAIQAQVMALLDLQWRFVAPVRIGDTLHVAIQVTDRQETSKPDRGIVNLARRVINQSGVVVQEGTTTLMVRRKDAS